TGIRKERRSTDYFHADCRFEGSLAKAAAVVVASNTAKSRARSKRVERLCRPAYFLRGSLRKLANSSLPLIPLPIILGKSAVENHQDQGCAPRRKHYGK